MLDTIFNFLADKKKYLIIILLAAAVVFSIFRIWPNMIFGPVMGWAAMVIGLIALGLLIWIWIKGSITKPK